MGLSTEIMVILVLTGMALFAINFILMKYNKRFAGLSIILLGFTFFALPEKVPNIAEYIYGSILIFIAIGIFITLYGAVNGE